MAHEEVGQSPKERGNCQNHAVMQLIVETMDKNLQKIDAKMDVLIEQQTQGGRLCLLREHEMKTMGENIKEVRSNQQSMAQLHESDLSAVWDEIASLRRDDTDNSKDIAEMKGASGMAKWMIPIGIGLLSGLLGGAISVAALYAKLKGA